jgi:hypothetical protein
MSDDLNKILPFPKKPLSPVKNVEELTQVYTQIAVDTGKLSGRLFSAVLQELNSSYPNLAKALQEGRLTMHQLLLITTAVTYNLFIRWAWVTLLAFVTGASLLLLLGYLLIRSA